MRRLSCLMLGFAACFLPAVAAEAGFKGGFGYGPGLAPAYRFHFPVRQGFYGRPGFYGRFVRHKFLAGRYGFQRFRYGAPFYGYGLWPAVQAPEFIEPDADADLDHVRFPRRDPYAHVPGIPPSPVAPPVIYVLGADRGSRPMRPRKAPLRFGAGTASPYAYEAPPYPGASLRLDPGSGARIIRVIAPGR